MASILTNNLYPPIVDTYMPAFVYGEDSSCDVVFRLSNYNDINDIASETNFSRTEDDITENICYNVIVTVRNQLTNQNVLNSRFYPAGYMLTTLQASTNQEGEYYITIENDDIEGGFQINHFYNVQISLISSQSGLEALDDYVELIYYSDEDEERYHELEDELAEKEEDLEEDIPVVEQIEIRREIAAIKRAMQIILRRRKYLFKISSWYVRNIDYFSEWSTVCILKSIAKPVVTLVGFDEADNRTVAFSTNVIETSGYIDFGDTPLDQNAESESLKQYKFTLATTANPRDIIEDSGWLYPTAMKDNNLSYTFLTQIPYDVEYTITLTYVTRNYYTESLDYRLVATQRNHFSLEGAVLSATADEDDGFINLWIRSSQPYLGNIILRRADSTTNFKIWEDINVFNINTFRNLNEHWKDYTVQSGVWYKYLIQRRSLRGLRGDSIYLSTYQPYTTKVILDGSLGDQNVMVMTQFEDMFLTGGNEQLKIRFNPNISNFKVNVADTKSDTLGSKYPFFKRNGAMEYKSFSISGTIHSYMDNYNIFYSRDEALGDFVDSYDAYNENHGNRFNTSYDYFYESKFKEKVLSFLYKNNVKLFRSTAEGNILVKLMDISFTPNQSTNRLLYDFSATAYEIDAANIPNYIKYKILDFGLFDPNLNERYQKVGQFYKRAFSVGDDVVQMADERWRGRAVVGYKYVTNSLAWIRLEFNSAPYLISSIDDIDEDGNTYTKLDIIESDPLTYEGDNYTVLVGYIVTINGRDIYVSSKHRFYELTGNDSIPIYSLSFPVETNVTIDYIGDTYLIEDLSKQVSIAYYEKVMGQLYGVHYLNQSLKDRIASKYLIKMNRRYRKLANLEAMAFEVDPFTSVMIKDTLNNTPPTDPGEHDNYERHIVNKDGYLRLFSTDAQIDDVYLEGIYSRNATDRAAGNDKYRIKTDEFIDKTYQENSDIMLYHTDTALLPLDRQNQIEHAEANDVKVYCGPLLKSGRHGELGWNLTSFTEYADAEDFAATNHGVYNTNYNSIAVTPQGWRKVASTVYVEVDPDDLVNPDGLLEPNPVLIYQDDDGNKRTISQEEAKNYPYSYIQFHGKVGSPENGTLGNVNYGTVLWDEEKQKDVFKDYGALYPDQANLPVSRYVGATLVLVLGEELSYYDNGTWYPFEKINDEFDENGNQILRSNGIIKKNIQGFIDYYGGVEEGVYAE